MRDELVLSIFKRDAEKEDSLSKIFSKRSDGALCLGAENTYKVLQKISSKTFYNSRIDAEFNTKVLQLIPYIYILDKNKQKYFCSQRTKLGGDDRLYGFNNLGFGGHCDRMFEDSIKSLFGNIYRELDEEIDGLVHKTIGVHSLKGFIYDGSNSVGQVHLGIVVEVEALKDNLKLGERSHKTGKFISLEDAVKEMDKFENWSKILINSFLRM